MTIEQLNKEITAEINNLREGELGEVHLDDEFFGNAPEPEVFLEPPPDVMTKMSTSIINEDDNFPALTDNDIISGRILQTYPFLLGMYIPMNSPGQIILFGSNLLCFYKSLLRAICPSIQHLTKLDLNAAWTLVRMKTHSHELFHYYCDVLHGLFGGNYSYKIEEAMAVAWARHCIQEQRNVYNSQIGRMNGLFYNQLMNRAFNYRSAGYDDWVLYADDVRFKKALVDYMAPGGYQKLQGNGVDVDQLIHSLMLQCRGGFVERVC
jgi:hypothetical protein